MTDATVMGKPGVALTELAKRILSVHTSPQEAGRVFSSAKPRLAVYTHIGAVSGAGQTAPQPADFIAATRETYSGPLEFGEDRPLSHAVPHEVGFGSKPAPPFLALSLLFPRADICG